MDGHILLDAGPPLLPHMHRLSIDPGAIDTIFLSHYHGDHTFGLASFILHRIFRDKRPLTIVGPAGVEQKCEALFRLAWADEFWNEFGKKVSITYCEAGARGEVNGIPYETVPLPHGGVGDTGYRLWIDGRLLAYSGDTEPTPLLERLVAGAEVAIVEATGPGDQYSHMSWEASLALRDRHPGTRFLFNHVYEGVVEDNATDLQVIDV